MLFNILIKNEYLCPPKINFDVEAAGDIFG